MMVLGAEQNGMSVARPDRGGDLVPRGDCGALASRGR